MGKRKIAIKKSVAESIAEISWYIESKGMLGTAEKFSDSIYDFFLQFTNEKKVHRLCQEPTRASLGFKSINFKKYTVVFIESESEITVCEFIPSKLIWW